MNLKAELYAQLGQYADRRTEAGHVGVVRNGYLPEREIQTGIGPVHMMFKLGMCAEKKWRRLRGFDYLAKVITGIAFKDGIEVQDVDQIVA